MALALDSDACARLEAQGQAHLVDHARTLGDAANAFLREAAAYPWEELRSAFGASDAGAPPALRPPQALTLRRQANDPGLVKRLAELGRGLLAGGRVATMLLAGGQGTRLGHPGPKGTFVLGPDADRSLYAIHAERIAAASRVAGRPVPLVVLVSAATEAATREAFFPTGDSGREASGGAAAWGLSEDQVIFVRQRALPALDDEGRALLAAPGVLATAPDGHGGSLTALAADGLLDRFADAGIDVLTTFQVDNPLALPLDPVMLGWMVERRAEAVGKAVPRLPTEKVGVYAREVSGRHLIVEYSEFPDGGMPEDLTMGSIALHAFSLRWLKGLFDGGYLPPLHRARKKVTHLGANGEIVTPTEPNAWKLERFVFDVLPEAQRVEVHEVLRDREFAPVKNAAGVDSAETSRDLVAAEVRRCYAAAGREAPSDGALRPLELP